jgi:hypothetical protein
MPIHQGHAEDEISQRNSAASASPDTQQPVQKKPQVKSKGSVPREKEAEGTQAPKRFDTDIIIKSKYGGLEVDTD